MQNKRYLSLDLIRSMAIILMIVFHFCFDLNYFGFIDIDIYKGLFWTSFRSFIVTLFLLCVGISLYLANENGIQIQKNLKRFGVLIFFASLITLVTYFIFPQSWIYFGILHFIAFASLLSLPFVKTPLLSLILGMIIVTLSVLNIIDMHWLYELLKSPLHIPKGTEDLAPLTPWLGVVLVGIFIGYKRLFDFHVSNSFLIKNLSYLGKHALIIYMVHQPLLFGSLFLISSIVK